MRARRRGHIFNISSTGGRIGNPGSGFYSATKFAIAGLSDALRKELQPIGIHVTVVEPSGFRTDFAGRSLQQSKRVIEDYDAGRPPQGTKTSYWPGRRWKVLRKVVPLLIVSPDGSLTLF